MARDSHLRRLQPPPCYGGEAWAVVAEALALERETIADTQQLIDYIDGGPPQADPDDDLAELRESARRLAASAWSIQYPPTNPYVSLGAEVFPLAQRIIEIVDPPPPPPSGDAPPRGT